MHRIVALWCHPRSVSSAMERMVMGRGDFATFHEPFMYFYYVHEARRSIPHFEPDPAQPARFEDIERTLTEAARVRPVFFKDMSFYVLERLAGDPGFVRRVTNTFLVRDPARSIPSYHALDPDVTLEEIGHEALWRHFEMVAEATGETPVVIDADDLQSRPEATVRAYCAALGIPFMADALAWRPGLPESWSAMGGWHHDVGASSGIEAPESAPPGLDTPAMQAHYAHHRPFYERLRAHRLAPLDG